MKKSLLKAYAELIVMSGIALQKGQDVIIQSNVATEEFAALVAAVCYKHGAKHVTMRWYSQLAEKSYYRFAKEKVLGDVLPFDIEFQKYCNDVLPCLIWIDSDDPDALAGVDSARVALAKSRQMKTIWPLREPRENKYQWCIAGAASPLWAKKVFPELSKKQAMDKLWEAILSTSRASDGNGIANWVSHDLDLKKRCAYLNNLNLRSLHYTSSNGTDLTVGLIPGVIFLGGGEKTLPGAFFQPNIPSEECFTSPMKGVAEGIVYAAKPLAYQGVLIEDFSVRFHEGKAVEVHAKKGEEALKGILAIDEGSAYLGECALVPFDSPINNTGILFFNTLYDENACCHLALGRGFTELYPNFEKYSEEQLHGFGINKSSSHVDFMIGSADLSIVGTDASGKQIPLFKNGNWAF
jgi:aminopeptidase